MPSAEILTIGTEILLGEILDTNARHIALGLRDLGLDLYYTATVGDNADRIAEFIQDSLQRADILITTGGLGPTVDDPTREAVALAFKVPLEFQPELWEQVQARFARFGRVPTENNRRQAYVPEGAQVIENPVGTAPAFRMERDGRTVICLPGVPREMEHLLEHAVLPYLRDAYQLTGVIKTRVLHTAGEGESAIDELISDLEKLRNPTVGLAAHAGQVDIRITVKAGSETEADELITLVELDLRQRLGDRIYGADEDTLEGTALAHLAALGWKVAVVESGLSGELAKRLAGDSGVFAGGEVLPPETSLAELKSALTALMTRLHTEAGLGVGVRRGEEKSDLHLVIVSPVRTNAITRSYGGPPKLVSMWAVNTGLDILRKLKN
ncbi:MAG: CinA family nicotinamide mononucleotide deamidase-related protein [Anaerolineae bacterium]|nr:MAG: CinA family nicotinamide mononucleotide deamidase-related protein [Anaerolineae bacterium]